MTYGNAQQKAEHTITASELKHHLLHIASDSLQGRNFSTPVQGLEMAAEYLKQEAKKIGLKAGVNDYFQEFELKATKPRHNKCWLSVYGRKNKIVHRTDSIVALNGTKSIDSLLGEAVFAGFGWKNDESGYDDFNSIDVKDKIVIYAAGRPQTFFDKEKSRWNNNLEREKMKSVFAMGATTVIIITNPNDKKNSFYTRAKRWSNRLNYTINKEDKGDENVFFIITPQVADIVFGEQGKTEELLTSIAKKNKPKSFPVKRKKIEVKVQHETDSVKTKNVIAIVKGSDPKLKDECVVFMAHYDHLGMSKKGEIFNGADDNGSGVVALLEIAEAFAKLEQKPDRSIVFAWVTAEEIGLKGSEYYTQHPVFPLENTIATINLDMVGRVYEPRDSIWRKSPKLVKNFDGIYTLTSNFYPELETITDSLCTELGLVPDKTLPDYFFRSSDHHHFHSKGVPIVNLATGYHADYHKVSDEVSKINFEKIKRVSHLAYLIGLELANKKRKIQ